MREVRKVLLHHIGSGPVNSSAMSLSRPINMVEFLHMTELIRFFLETAGCGGIPGFSQACSVLQLVLFQSGQST